MSLVKVKTKFQVTIPADLRDRMHLKEGDMLEAVIEGDVIVLKPMVVLNRETLVPSKVTTSST